MPDTATFAFCFSHGRMHTFRPSEEYPDGAWCTAQWVPLEGANVDAAWADKTQRYGDAQFMHHLSLEQQASVYELAEKRSKT